MLGFTDVHIPPDVDLQNVRIWKRIRKRAKIIIEPTVSITHITRSVGSQPDAIREFRVRAPESEVRKKHLK